MVFISSLAAVGPSSGTRLLTEEDECRPVSHYGRSKLACEQLAAKYSKRMPISVVRAPIVLGEGDEHGLELFKTIDRFHCHFVPGFRNRLFSIIHAHDLVDALIAVAERGKRLDMSSNGQGIYFAAANEVVTYADLGRQIGKAVGNRWTLVIRVIEPCIWLSGAINELIGRIKGQPQYLNLDKSREAVAGPWACSAEKLRKEVGFDISVSIQTRLQQTVAWFRQKGWLRDKQKSQKQDLKDKRRDYLAKS